MAYITYAEYTERGGELPEPAFDRFYTRAKLELDYYTQRRITKLKEIPEDIKLLMVELIGLADNFSQGDKVESFSNEGIAVTFEKSASEAEQAYNLIKIYAQDYIFRGIDP